VQIPAVSANIQTDEDGDEGDDDDNDNDNDNDDDNDLGPRVKACFLKEQLRILFASLPNGTQTVEVLITGNLTGGSSFQGSVSVIVVKEEGLARGHQGRGPKNFPHASPNPFNPSTTINFELSRPGSVNLRIYDVAGRLVKTLTDGFMGSGPHSVGWDGTTRDGSRVSSGVYFYVLQTPERTVKSQLVVMK
jgi:hypothetical protein